MASRPLNDDEVLSEMNKMVCTSAYFRYAQCGLLGRTLSDMQVHCRWRLLSRRPLRRRGRLRSRRMRSSQLRRYVALIARLGVHACSEAGH